MLTVAQNQGDLQPLRRIGFSDRTCAWHWLPFATYQRILWHSSTLLLIVDMCRAGSANDPATTRSGSRTELEILVCKIGIAKRSNKVTIPQIFVKIKSDRY
jgi:hypothetical protein